MHTNITSDQYFQHGQKLTVATTLSKDKLRYSIQILKLKSFQKQVKLDALNFTYYTMQYCM